MRAKARSARLMAVVLVLAATGCTGGTANDAAPAGSCTAGEGAVKIATGNPGGVYYALGGGLAQVIGANTKLKATAESTGASVQNIQQLADGRYDVAFALADTAADAVNGTGVFAGRPQRIQALARLYPNSTQVLVRNGSGINSITDMRGKRISIGSPQSGTEIIATRLLEAAGLNPNTDIQAQRLDLAATAEGVKAGTIDGLVWSGGLPTAQLSDIITSLKGQVKFLDITPLLGAMRKINPVYDTGEIPVATYAQQAAVPTIVVPNFLLVRSDFPAPEACAITKLLFEKKNDLAQAHPSAEQIDPGVAKLTQPVPLHPGAKQALGG
ncbi:TAXI family TRAP transporter solute-binding subunit [Amycolatopsis minnesotensis]|uniref:TAXI family TRAP transporter solute-binding subunit n=1 Tax=Amycolatopsis minnesotensis TaxID=337894 RepID=A0ABP5DRS3_9PSEU